jgi:hypothetical protein
VSGKPGDRRFPTPLAVGGRLGYNHGLPSLESMR